MANLIISLHDGRTMHVALGSAPQVIGRDADCDIVIEDPGASRRHAQFVPSGNGYLVEDLGSKNGTMVNDEPCRSHLLMDGDRVLIGSANVRYSESESKLSQSVVISDEATDTHATRYVSHERQLDLSKQRLRIIYEMSGRLTTLQDRDALVEDAMQICFDMLQFERGAVGVRRPGQRSLDWPVVRNLRGTEGELTISRTLLSRALNHGERAIFTDSGAGNADPSVSMVQAGVRSAMCVPLMNQDQTLGVIYGDRTSTSTAYTNEDIDFFAGIAQQVSIGLINCQLVEEQQQMARIERDIELARSIQTGLFPAKLPNRKGLRVAAINDPGQRVSGDYYDVIETTDGRVWCLIADATGEGVAASLLMANLQAAVRVTIEDADDPAELLERWNQLICHNTAASKFITCVLALIDPAGRRIQQAVAGHCPPLVVQPDAHEPRWVETETGFPLGIVEDATYKTSTLELGPEPCVYFCYTDGVIEAMNGSEEMYGTARLRDVLAQQGELNPGALTKQVRKSVAGFTAGAPQSDDITLLATLLG